MSGCETTWQSLPYGDGLTSSGNCSDTSELHFTGKERDEESGNDYFPARYYGSPLGRWMSPDHYMGSYDPFNPQSFNRYSYVLNDPLVFTDPSGLDPCSEYGGEGGGCSQGDDGGLIAFLDQVAHDIAGLFTGPSFHGGLKPRPNSQPWPEYNPQYGPNIAAALGLPDEQCDFGVCDGGVMSTPIKN